MPKFTLKRLEGRLGNQVGTHLVYLQHLGPPDGRNQTLLCQTSSHISGERIWDLSGRRSDEAALFPKRQKPF